MSAPLTPPTLTAPAQDSGRFPFAFTPRFLIALALGLLWLAPALWFRGLVAVMFGWNALLLLLWLIDFFRLPPPASLEVERAWAQPLSLARHAQVSLTVRNRGPQSLSVTITDTAPNTVAAAPPGGALLIPSQRSAHLEYTILPRQRGDQPWGNIFLAYRSAFAFAERRAVVPLHQTVRVLPDLVLARDLTLHLLRTRSFDQDRRRRRKLGLGREFQSLRDYRTGDDSRDVCWTATARRNRLISRTFEIERSQTAWIVIDSGRLLRARVRSASGQPAVTKLDHAVNCALALAQVISQSGDRAGLLVYGDSVKRVIAPARGPAQIRLIIDSLAPIRPDAVEADHAHAAQVLLRHQTRRALIIWITDFAETPATPDVIEFAARVSRHHLVLFTAISQPDLAALAESVPESPADMFRFAAALEIQDRRELLLRRLAQQGVLAMELPAAQLAPALINQYLEIKDRGLL